MSIRTIYIYLVLGCIFISINTGFASKPGKKNSNVQVSKFNFANRSFFFEENIGQLADEKGNLLSDIKYYGYSNNVHVYCKSGKISFVFARIKNKDNSTLVDTENNSGIKYLPGNISKKMASMAVILQTNDSLYNKTEIVTTRMDLVFVGSNPNTQIIPQDKLEYYENFYNTGNADHGFTNAHTYNTVIYEDIYPHIDLILKSSKKGMEYSFLVHPFGNVNDIKLRWDGTEKIENYDSGCCRRINALGTVDESAPKCYVDGENIESSFSNKGDGYGFKVTKYNKNKDLIIDPTLIWGTYFGGSNSYDQSYATVTDVNGNVYIAGRTFNSATIATSGAYQTESHIITNSSGDAFLAKFTNKGKIIWSTYYGGEGDDIPLGLCSDPLGNIYMTGYTTSSSGIATTDAYQTSYTINSVAAFIVNFTNSGSLKWATYFTAGCDERGESICMDQSGEVYVVGWTCSTSGLASSGAYQTSGGGKYDGFVAKFSGSGKFYWASYIGGSANDYASGVGTDPSGNVFVAGWTGSSKGIASSGAYQTSFKGTVYNGFVAKFSSSGSLNWATYYGGDGIVDIFALSSDVFGNAYVTGCASSNYDIATSGAYQTSYFANESFLAKFSASGNLVWGTYYGGKGNDWGNGICTDGVGDIYITGWTTSSTGLATTDAYQTSLSGSQDAFVAKFTRSGNLAWATYFGGNNSTSGQAVCVDTSGALYLTGFTTSSNGIATSGAFQTSLVSGEDNFLAKFSSLYLIDAGIDSIKSPKSNICAGTQPVIVRLKNFGIQKLSSVKIIWTVNDTGQKSFNWTGSLPSRNTIWINLGNILFSGGKNTLKVWTEKPNSQKDSIPDNDSLKISISINPLPLAIAGVGATICSGSRTIIGSVPISGHTYLWKSNPPGFSSSGDYLTVSPANTTWYFLKETINATGCTNSDSVKITVNPIPAVIAGTPQTICLGQSVFIGTVPAKGLSYYWISSPKGYTSTDSSPFVSPKLSTEYILTETITATGCSNTDSVKITVNPLPDPGVGTDKSICNGNSAIIGINSVNGYAYKWTSNPSNGFVCLSSDTVVKPKQTTFYRLTETIIATGCSRTDSVLVTVNPLPLAKTGGDKSICAGDKTTVGSASVNGDTYIWTSNPPGFSTTSSNPTITPVVKTTFILKETTANGCANTDSAVITVNPIPNDPHLIKLDSVCYGLEIGLQYHPISGISFGWTSHPIGFTNTDSIVKTRPKQSTNYLLTQKFNTTGCIRVDSESVIVLELPKPHISGSTLLCGLGNSTYMTPTNGKDTYFWEANTGSILSGQKSATINVGWSSYQKRLVKVQEANSSSCINSDSLTVIVSNPPKAGFKCNNGCQFDNIRFVDTSVRTVKWAWNFGGTTQTGTQDPVHIFFKAGNYKVSETVTNTEGCTDTTTRNITIYPVPVLNWIIKRDTGRTINIHVSDSAYQSYLWDFGDGTVLRKHSGVHYYPKNGKYNINLSVTNNAGCATIYDSIITIDFTYPKDTILVFPNPFQDHIIINYTLAEDAIVSLMLYDALGRLIYTNLIDKKQSAGSYSLHPDYQTYTLASGIYFLRFVIDGKEKVIKVIKI